MILETNSNSSSSPPSSADSSPSKQQSTNQESNQESNQANQESNQANQGPRTDQKCNQEGLKVGQKIRKSGSSTVSLSATVSTHQLDTFIPSGTDQKFDTFTGHSLDTFTPEKIVSRSVSNLILDQDAEGGSTTEIIMTLKWDKLSPAEFQQLQDYIQCKFLFLFSSFFLFLSFSFPLFLLSFSLS